MALKPGQPKKGQLSLAQFKDKVTTKRKLENLQKRKDEGKELVATEEEKKTPQTLSTGGYVPKRLPTREPLDPVKLQEMIDNHSKIMEKHGPKIQAHLRFLQKTRP